MLELYEQGVLGHMTLGEDALGEANHITSEETMLVITSTEIDVVDSAPFGFIEESTLIGSYNLPESVTIASESTIASEGYQDIQNDVPWLLGATEGLSSASEHSYEDAETVSASESLVVEVFVIDEDNVTLSAAIAFNILGSDTLNVADDWVMHINEDMQVDPLTSSAEFEDQQEIDANVILQSVADQDHSDAGNITSSDLLVFLSDFPLADSGSLVGTETFEMTTQAPYTDTDQLSVDDQFAIFTAHDYEDSGTFTDEHVLDLAAFFQFTEDINLSSGEFYESFGEHFITLTDEGLLVSSRTMTTASQLHLMDEHGLSYEDILTQFGSIVNDDNPIITVDELYTQLYLIHLDVLDSGILTIDETQSIVTGTILLPEPAEDTSIPELQRVDSLPFLREDVERDLLFMRSYLPFLREDIKRDFVVMRSYLPYLVKQGKLYER